MVRVRKDDGSIESFDKSKVIESIRKETGCTGKVIEEIVDDVYNTLSVLKIDPVTGPLIREFINTKFLERNMNDCKRKYTRVGMPVYDARMTDIGGGKGDNANLQRSPETIHKRKADQLAKEQALLMLPEHLSEAHLNGNLHIHDLEYITSRYFCADWDLRYVFYYGFTGDGTGEHTSVAGPAMRPEVAILHASKTLGSGQVNFAGGEGFYNFLCFLSPYFKDCSFREIKQNMQCFIYEMTQMLTSRGGQQIFSSVQLSPSIPQMWADKPAVYKGKIGPETYGEFERENRLLFKAFMEVMYDGDYAGKPFYFPKPEIAFEPEYITKMEHEDEHGINGDYPSIRELYLLAFKLASKFGTPYFDNMIPPYRGAGKGISCMQCIPSDEYVVKESPLGICIDKVKRLSPNERIYSHGVSKYNGILKNEVAAQLYCIKLESGREFKCTSDHTINVYRSGQLIKVNACEVIIGDALTIDNTLPTDNIKFEEFYHEFIRYDLDATQEEVAYVIGTISAEGNILVRDSKTGGSRLQISMGTTPQEVQYSNKICSILTKCGYTVKQKMIRTWETRLLIYNTNLCKMLIKWRIPEKTRRKGFVPDFIFTANESIKFAYLHGYYRGDGTFGLLRGKFPHISIQTGSKLLQLGTMMLLESLGIKTTGYYIESRDMYTIDIARRDEINRFFSCISTNDTIRRLPVKKITREQYIGNVYDPIDVEENNEFRLGNGIIVGNCCAFSFSSGEEGDPDFDNKLYFKDGKHFTMGSAQVITLNMPRYAYESGGDVTAFIELCKQNIQLAIEIFKIKRVWITECINNGMLPFPTHTKRDPLTGKLIPPFLDLSDYVFTVGIVGMNEVCEIMLGKPLYEDSEAHLFTLKLCNELNKYCKKITIEHDIKLSFSRTPAETTAQRFAVLDLLNYGDAHKFVKGDVRAAIKKYAETGSRDLPIYYTNGTHCPVDANIPIAEKIRIEQAFFPILDGGNICNIYLGEQRPDPRGLMDMTLKICKSTNLGYFAFTRDFTVCNNGYRQY